VVQPERTIVRELDEALPVILSGAAPLLVLAGVGSSLVRTRNGRAGPQPLTAHRSPATAGPVANPAVRTRSGTRGPGAEPADAASIAAWNVAALDEPSRFASA